MMTTNGSQLTTKKKKRPSKVELVRLDKLEALIADTRLAEAASDAARAAAVAEAAALRDMLIVEEAAQRDILREIITLAEQEGMPSIYRIASQALSVPSPAVAALEQRLAKAAGTEERLRLLIEHHREHHAAEERWERRLACTAQLEEELAASARQNVDLYNQNRQLKQERDSAVATAGTHWHALTEIAEYPALSQLPPIDALNDMRRLAQDAVANCRDGVAALKQRLAPMPCGHPGACVVSADEGVDYCAWCEDIRTIERLERSLEEAAMHRATLTQRLSRAEALAALVPSAELLNRLAGYTATLAALHDFHGDPSQGMVDAKVEARALAARIEEARGPGGGGTVMLEVTPADMDYGFDKIVEMATWPYFQGFTADTCGKCKSTVNVLAGGAGWLCPCGHYNASLPWHGMQIPHKMPHYGPPRERIVRALARGREDGGGD